MKNNLLLIVSLFVLTISHSQMWTELNTGTSAHLLSIDFPDLNNGWVVGTDGTILHTINQGDMWESQDSETSSALYYVDFIDNQTGYAVGDASTVRKTIDGGETWEEIDVDVTADFRIVFFLNATIGFIGGGIGSQSTTILKTSNGGDTWIPLNVDTGEVIYGIFFTDANHGYASDGGGNILETTDGGLNWTDETIGQDVVLDCVYFTDSNTGYISGENGTMMKTTDGGENWESQDTGTTERLISVRFSDTNTGFAFGGNVGALSGSIYRTNNDGLTWDLTASNDHLLYRSSFPISTQGYCCGRDGTVLRIKEIVNQISEDEIEVENTVLIYPNPTSDFLNVELNLSKSSTLQVEIYDANGKLISANFNKTLSAGAHRIPLGNIGAVDAGTYTLLITINNKQQISRIIKI